MKNERQRYRLFSSWILLLLFLFPSVSQTVHSLSLPSFQHHCCENNAQPNPTIQPKGNKIESSKEKCLICDFQLLSFTQNTENILNARSFEHIDTLVQNTRNKEQYIARFFSLRAPPVYC
ncbi:MAG: hypothetical protein ACK5JS_05820 [Mangrovibacterium sp.]